MTTKQVSLFNVLLARGTTTQDKGNIMGSCRIRTHRPLSPAAAHFRLASRCSSVVVLSWPRERQRMSYQRNTNRESMITYLALKVLSPQRKFASGDQHRPGD